MDKRGGVMTNNLVKNAQSFGVKRPREENGHNISGDLSEKSVPAVSTSSNSHPEGDRQTCRPTSRLRTSVGPSDGINKNDDDDDDDHDDDKDRENRTFTSSTPPSSFSVNNTNTMKTLRKLRLEAIFHPKFENENRSDTDIRRRMLQLVQSNGGYLEVTLKHSGSLLLWSGDQRYYSKNSTENQFTHAGEILLRQHFIRAWHNSNVGNNDREEDESIASMEDAQTERKYSECSDFVSKRRLTLAFEVVTSILGHHGSIPHCDFLILTAVADLRTERFYTTSELVAFAQRFRLPHNDSWIFCTEASANRLFHLYDTNREVGMAQDTVQALNETAEEHVCSVYPHFEFQGNILEGIVIRYVPYRVSSRSTVQAEAAKEAEDKNKNDDMAGSEQERVTMNELASESRRILDLIPPNKPPCFDLVSFWGKKSTDKLSIPPLLTTNLRELYRKVMHRSQHAGSTSFEDALHTLLIQSDGERRTVVNVNTQNSSSSSSSSNKKMDGNDRVDIPKVVQDLLLTHRHQHHENPPKKKKILDTETERIATLIQTLHTMDVAVQFKVYRETKEGASATTHEGIHRERITPKMKSDTSREKTDKSRWLCIVHILNDSIFPKYRKVAGSDSMPLFRGFCVRMVFEGDEDDDDDDDDDNEEDGMDGIKEDMMSNVRQALESTNLNDAKGYNGEKLMLKMKFLPYMVRTFGCRNGLGILSKNGPEAFDQYTLGLLKKWGVSQDAIDKWQPFFHSWGLYAYRILQKEQMIEKGRDALVGKDVDDGGGFPPLSGQYYLDHLERFSERYFSENVDSQGDEGTNQMELCTFRGLVVVVALDVEATSAVADYVAQQLGGCRRCGKVNSIKEEDISLALLPRGGGLVCSAVVEDGVKNVRSLLKKHDKAISVILFGCSDAEIEASLPPGKERSKRLGMAKAWRKLDCAWLLDLRPASLIAKGVGSPGSESLFQHPDDFVKAIKKLRGISDSLPKADTRPGLLVFFPGIPGSGKSAISGAETAKALYACLAEIISGSESTSSGDCGIKESSEKKAVQKRNVIVRVGDKVKEKYWPLVKRERLGQPSSVYIADKNAPPSAWPTVGEVCSKSRAVAVPVLPAGAALKTTTVTGMRGLDGSHTSDRVHFYPFSLHYLAVCIARVLDRKGKSHTGKLDTATENACMIVVKFFALYRNLAAEDLEAVLTEKGDAVGAVTTPTSVKVPFFVRDNLPDLPNDLDEALRDALRLQLTLDSQGNDRADDKAKSVALNEMDKRLRTLVKTHSSMLKSLTVGEEESRSSFVSQIAEHVAKLPPSFHELEKNLAITSASASSIKLVSIGVDVQDIHRILNEASKKYQGISAFLKSVGGICGNDYSGRSGTKVDSEKSGLPTAKFVTKPHVTMAHYSQLSQIEMKTRFGKLLDRSVDLVVTGFLYSEEIAAFAVTVGRKTSSSGDEVLEVPLPQNQFPHITVWYGDGRRAVESNELPSKVLEGKAFQVDFDEAFELNGVIQFWTDTTNDG